MTVTGVGDSAIMLEEPILTAHAPYTHELRREPDHCHDHGPVSLARKSRSAFVAQRAHCFAMIGGDVR